MDVSCTNNILHVSLVPETEEGQNHYPIILFNILSLQLVTKSPDW